MIYDYHVVLGVIAASFGIAGYVIYIRSILRGFTRPHIFTWLIYVIVDGTIFAAQLAGGGGPGAFVVLTGAVANAAIVILAFQRGEKNITLSDWACFYFGTSRHSFLVDYEQSLERRPHVDGRERPRIHSYIQEIIREAARGIRKYMGIGRSALRDIDFCFERTQSDDRALSGYRGALKFFNGLDHLAPAAAIG